MERGLAPTALPAPSASESHVRDLGPFPVGGESLLSSTCRCPFCHKNGYKKTTHGSFQTVRRAKDLTQRTKPSATAPTDLMTAPPIKPAAAREFTNSFTTDGYAAYIDACKIACVTAPETIDASTVIVSAMSDADMLWIQRLEGRQRRGRVKPIFTTTLLMQIDSTLGCWLS